MGSFRLVAGNRHLHRYYNFAGRVVETVELSLLLLTFQHRAGVSPYTSSFDLAETCVFAKQSPGPIHCGSLSRALLFPKLRSQFAEFLNYPSPAGLRILFLSTCVGLRYGPPVSVCGTGTNITFTKLFSPLSKLASLLFFGPLRPGLPAPGSSPSKVSFCLSCQWLRNINRMCIDYAFRPRLSSRLTWSGRTFLQKP